MKSQDIPEYVEKKRKEFLAQDEYTLWQFVEQMANEVYSEGRKHPHARIGNPRKGLPRTRHIGPKSCKDGKCGVGRK